MTLNITVMLLIIALVGCLFFIFYLKSKKNKTILHKEFLLIYTLLGVYLMALILQIFFNGYDQIYFDYITYVSGVYLPVAFIALSLTYLKPDFNVKKILWMLILPTFSLFVLWTNDLHHLFFVSYSTNINEGIVGPYFIIHSVYSYSLLVVALLTLIFASIRNSGFFSNQTALIVVGSVVPLLANILGTFKIISMTIYVTPVLFTFASVCYALAIIKYKALNITPIALRTIIDNMSDAFIVISNDGTVVDENQTFRDVFQNVEDIDSVTNLFDYAKNSDFINYDNLINKIDETKKIGHKVTIEYQITKDNFHKHFEVDIQPIKSKQGNEYVATLLLLKDVTQHKMDIETIEEKQDIIIKQSQLVTIGELAGGVAHDINTPISAIKSGILMFREMLGQRTENEMELLQRMDNCADKIIKIVNSMRNQIRNLGGTTNVEFKVVDVINDIKIISYNEVKKNNCELIINIEDDLTVKGDPTKLGQVLTNLIVNAVQAYKEKGGKVEVILTKAPDNMALIKVIDYAGGMDESIKPYVFKNILTTKGTLGTGLGLYLAYSVIKGEFGGEITFESEVGVGTTFYVAIKRS